MALHQCPECDKSFKDGEELYYHIDGFHRQIPDAIKKKCPHCQSDKVSFSGIGEESDVPMGTGIIKGMKHVFYICDDCKRLFKIKN
jgi:endogenous inhibitor of DNA gyrase (YacG/DUF329 family)